MKKTTPKTKPAAAKKPAPAAKPVSAKTASAKSASVKSAAKAPAPEKTPATVKTPTPAKTEPAKRPTSGKLPAPSKNALISKAAETLAPGAGRVAARVRLAVEDPKGYVKTHAKELSLRGVTSAVPRLPFLALLDGLTADGRVALVDAKSPAEDVVSLVRKLRAPVRLDFGWADSLDYESLEDLSTERFLEAIAARVEPAGAVLLNLETGSDQYAIIMVHRSRVNITLAAMKAAGYPARIVAAKALAEKPKAPVKRTRGGTAMEEWPDCSSDPSNTWRYFIHHENARSICLRKWPSAIDVMQESLSGPPASKSEKKSYATPRECTAAYVALYSDLQAQGWHQYTAQEHAKELKTRASKK